MENYNVYSVSWDTGMIAVDYSVTTKDLHSERCRIVRSEVPHEDFVKAYKAMEQLARTFIEIPLKDPQVLGLTVKKVNFLSSAKLGSGVRISVEVLVPNSIEELKITTPRYWESFYGDPAGGGRPGPNEMLQQEKKAVDLLKKEAFKYAYMGKRQQPTLEEAAAASKAGRFTDEDLL